MKYTLETYYIGEFGFFNISILPFLEDFKNFKNFIQNILKIKIDIVINTYYDYSYIINNLYPSMFVLKTIPLNSLRVCNDTLDFNKDDLGIELSYCMKNLLKNNDIGNNPPNIKEYTYIKNKITSNINLDDDNKIKNNIDNFICYFPRYRDKQHHNLDFCKRNANEKEIETILNKYTKEYFVVIVGNEILDYDYSKYDNVIVDNKNIEKTIFYLQHCKFLISNDSGFIDFAKNCGTEKIFIIKPITNYHFNFLPFNNDIKLLELEENN